MLVQGPVSLIQRKMLFNIVTLLALAPSVLAAVTDNGDKKKRSVVPGGYIVEFEDVMSIASDVCLDLSTRRLAVNYLIDQIQLLF